MRICVIGAGAIGGLMAVKLSASGEDVTVIARGAHLEAIRKDGLTLLEAGQEMTARVKATNLLAEAGEHDLIVLAVKAHQLAAVAADIAQSLAPETMVLTAQNGVPWWYFLKGADAHAGARLESVDPGGVIASHIPVEAVIGSVVYLAAEIVAPGVIRHGEGNRIT